MPGENDFAWKQDGCRGPADFIAPSGVFPPRLKGLCSRRRAPQKTGLPLFGVPRYAHTLPTCLRLSQPLARPRDHSCLQAPHLACWESGTYTPQSSPHLESPHCRHPLTFSFPFVSKSAFMLVPYRLSTSCVSPRPVMPPPDDGLACSAGPHHTAADDNQ